MKKTSPQYVDTTSWLGTLILLDNYKLRKEGKRYFTKKESKKLQRAIPRIAEEIEGLAYSSTFEGEKILFEEITDIDLGRMHYDAIRYGKTLEEAIQLQTPKINFRKTEELRVQANLFARELKDYERKSPEELTEFIQIISNLIGRVNSYQTYRMRRLAA